MEITEVKVYLPVEETKVKAYVSIVFEDCFVVRDLKVINADSKVFVAMPSKKMKDGSYRDMAHPLTQAMRQEIEDTVLRAYAEETNRQRQVVASY